MGVPRPFRGDTGLLYGVVFNMHLLTEGLLWLLLCYALLCFAMLCYAMLCYAHANGGLPGRAECGSHTVATAAFYFGMGKKFSERPRKL